MLVVNAKVSGRKALRLPQYQLYAPILKINTQVATAGLLIRHPTLALTSNFIVSQVDPLSTYWPH
jgi:hypothetical protein